MSVNLNSILLGIKELEPLPVTAVNLAKSLSDPKNGITEFVDIVKLDQAITANILRMANSASSSSSKSIVDIKQAVVRLGGARILTNLVGRHLSSDMSKPIPLYGYQENDLWRHSVAAAVATIAIKKVTSIPVPAVSFVAALLHDIGKLIISRNVNAEIVDQIFQIMATGETTECAEQHVLGFTHSDAGAELSSHWRLPDEITNAIKYHHNCTIQDPVADIVKLANFTARTIGEGLGDEGLNIKLGDDFFCRLKIEKQLTFQRICMETSSELLHTFESFGIK